MKIREYFEQLRTLDKEIDEELEKLESFYARATSITAQIGGERVQTSSSPDKMAGAVCKMVEVSERYNGLVDYFAEVKENCKIFIASLDDETTKEILFRRFFDKDLICDIASDYGKSRHWVYNRMDEAFEEIERKYTIFCEKLDVGTQHIVI